MIWPCSLISLALRSRSLIFPLSHRNERETGPPFSSFAAMSLYPTICFRLLIADAVLRFPPSVPRSIILPSSHRNACRTAVPSPFLALMSLSPTIWPRSLIASATLRIPPSVPRSRILPSSHRNAWAIPLLVSLKPMIWPLALIPEARPFFPPGRAPRCRGPAVLPHDRIAPLPRVPDNLASVVEEHARVAQERATEIPHLPVRQKNTCRPPVAVRLLPDNIAALVDHQPTAVPATQRAEIRHNPARRHRPCRPGNPDREYNAHCHDGHGSHQQQQPAHQHLPSPAPCRTAPRGASAPPLTRATRNYRTPAASTPGRTSNARVMF